MSDPRSRARSRRPLVVAGSLLALLTCCGLPLLWVTGDPFERVRSVDPLAVVEIDLDREPYCHHAAGRDELIFLQGSNLEVSRIDPNLTQIRVAPLAPEIDAAALWRIAAFPKSPLAAVFGDKSRLFVVNTQTGQVERRILLASDPEGVIVSPDEHWLALCLPVLTVIDLWTGERFELSAPRSGPPGYGGTTFLGPDSLFVRDRNTSNHHLWNLPTRQLRWSGSERDDNRLAISAAGDESRMVTGAHRTCQLWDVETGQVIRSHRGVRPVWSVALHPKTGDYLAGYTMLNFALPSRFSGAVRIWNADGEPLTTFGAHHDNEEPGVKWMVFSSSGDYLVTAGKRAMKVWDYHALTKR